MGKQLLKSNRKMYMVDLGLRNHILPRRRYDLGFSIENIVYFELLRRGYQVAIGKNGAAEVDFVAQEAGDSHVLSGHGGYDSRGDLLSGRCVRSGPSGTTTKRSF